MAISRPTCTALLVCLACASSAFGETWFERSDRVKAEQPHWLTPLATTTPRLEQEVRYDIVWQQPPGGDWFENIGNSKGLELIPIDNVEVIVGIPPYLARHGAGSSGF